MLISRMLSASLAFILLVGVGLTVSRADDPPSETSLTESGIWVVWDGKEQFAFDKDTKRLPVGRTITLRGKPLPFVLPQVLFKTSDTGKSELLVVRGDAKRKVWEASLPELEPLQNLEITVLEFRPVGDAERAEIRGVFNQMLLRLTAASANKDIPEKGLATERAEVIEALLRKDFPPEQVLTNFAVTPKPGTATVPLGETLIQLLGREGTRDLKLRNLLSDYEDALGNIQGTLLTHLDSLSEGYRSQLVAFWERAASHDSTLKIADLINPADPLLPLDEDTKRATRALLDSTRTKLRLGEVTTIESSIETLSTPLEKAFPLLFARLQKIESQTFSPRTISFPLEASDLLRYATVDYIEGYVLNKNVERGFVTFSFTPYTPQPRTPDELGDRWMVSIGSSVRGGDEDEDLFLVGLTFRANRYLSVVGGAVRDSDKDAPWYGILGFAGDVSAIPFLNDLFTIRP